MGTSDLKNCAAHFLEDEPCRAPSAFQIHEEIAQAIASEIKTGKSGNIALIGNWGSGKSTIVNRVQELLQSESGKDSESGDESTAAKKALSTSNLMLGHIRAIRYAEIFCQDLLTGWKSKAN